MRKKILAAVLSVFMVGSLIGCQSTAESTADGGDIAETTELTEEAETADSGVVELTVWAEEDNFEMLNIMIRII